MDVPLIRKLFDPCATLLLATLVMELGECASAFDADESIGAIILTGSGDKAFAAGADIKTMSTKSFIDMCD